MVLAHGSLPAAFTDTIYSVSWATPATFDAAGFAGSGMDYSVIGGIESFPPVGSRRNTQQFRPMRGGTSVSKGSPAYGGGDIVMADLPSDVGQVLLKAIEGDIRPCSIKALYADGETHYFHGHLMSWALQPSAESGVMKRISEFEPITAPVIVRASEYLTGAESGTGPLLMESGQQFEVSP